MSILEIPQAAYHADAIDPRPSLSKSIIHVLLADSPAHARAKHPRLNPGYQQEDKHEWDIGTAAHAILLEGRDSVEVVNADSWRTNAAKEARDAARADGKTPLLEKHWFELQAMLAATKQQLEAVDADPPLFTDGKPEQTIVWEDKGVLCRARLDWLRDDLRAIDDFKSTSRSANPEQWSRTLYSYGCDIQAAFYLRGLKTVTGADAEWRFVCQETFAPFALSVIALSPAVIALANEKVDVALDIWKRCLETNVWNGYPAKVCYAELPPWEEARFLERDALRTAA